MKKKQLLLSLTMVLVLTGFFADAQNLNMNFKMPPASVQTSVYWYWIDGNITKEGVIKDLEAMKTAGINRSFICNLGGHFLR